jgi:hypothetical protein
MAHDSLDAQAQEFRDVAVALPSASFEDLFLAVAEQVELNSGSLVAPSCR